MITKIEGTRELEKLWNLCYQVSKVGPDEQTRNEAKGYANSILLDAPRIGYTEIDSDVVESYKKLLTHHIN